MGPELRLRVVLHGTHVTMHDSDDSASGSVASRAARRLDAPENGESYAVAEAVAAAVREPLLLLTSDLRVWSANEPFHRFFGLTPEEIRKRPVYELGDARWNLPELRHLLEQELAAGGTVATLDVTGAFEDLGIGRLHVHARRLEPAPLILLTFEGIRDQRAELEPMALNETLRMRTQAQIESEQRYRALLDSVNEGFCVVQMIFDARNRPIDYRFIEMNPMFERHTGLVQPIGMTARELVPDLDESWYRIYGGVALSREPVRFQNYAPAMSRWFDVYAFPIGHADERQVALLFKDITANKHAEAELHLRTERLALLSDGAAALLAAADPHQLVRELYDRLAKMLELEVYVHFGMAAAGTHLELHGCQGFTDEQRRGLERLQLGQAVCGTVAQTRERIFVPDVQHSTDPKTEVIRDLGITAYVCHPLIARDQLFGTLSFGTRSDRSLDDEAIELIRSVCNLVASAIARKHAEESLTALRAESERRSRLYEAIMSATPDLIYVLDLDCRFAYANAALLEMCNQPWEQVHGRQLHSLGFTQPHAEMHEREVAEVIATKRPVRGEMEFIAGAGRRVQDYIFVPVLNVEGDVEAVAGMTRDVTERKRAEDVLRESEERFRTLADTSPAMQWITDANNTCTFLSRQWYAFTGQREGEGLDFGWSDAVHPDDRRNAVRQFKSAAEARRPIVLDFRLRHCDGSYRWALDQGQPRFDDRGNWLGYIGCVIDVHDRMLATEALRQSEQQLRELSASLEQRVAERTTQLRAQTVRLRHLAARLTSAEQRERKHLAAMLHDDLQQLLFAASMQLSMLREGLTDEVLASRIDGAAQRVDAAANAARHLTRQLRPPALYEAGLVPALRWLASDMAKQHKLDVALHAHEDKTSLDDDVKALLYDAVRELLFNAVKHAGVDRVDVEVRESGDHLHVIVRDAGRGFDAEALAEQKDGGFGLFSVRERLGALGGAMTVVARKNEGTRIELELPIRLITSGMPMPPQTAEVRAPSTQGLAAQPGRTGVIVVDDHAIVREGIANTLSVDDRLEVLGGAADGASALELIARFRPHVVLMDLNMPGINGLEATRTIHERWPDIAIVGMSVQGDDATASSMLAAGASAFVPKAGDSEQMIRTILNAVPERRQAAHPAVPEEVRIWSEPQSR
jgi:PAS domain S-box-containing protein